MDENPYNPLQPTDNPLFFFGREDAKAFLQRRLASTINPYALLIFGQRGIGKSSLLAQVHLLVDERYPTVLIDVSNLDLDDPVGLVAAIVDNTRLMMEAIEASTYRLPDFPDPTDSDVDLLRWLADEYLSVVMKAIWQERHLILILDNIHLLFDAIDRETFPADFMDYLSGLLETYERLNLIGSVDIAYERRASEVRLFQEQNFHYRLTNLGNEAALRVIQEPVREVYTFEPAALERVWQLAGGHPFHIHSLCRLLFRLHTERNLTTIMLSDIEAVYTAALEQTAEIVEPLWQQARPNERLILTALLDLRQKHPDRTWFEPEEVRAWLSHTDYPLDDIQLAAAWRGLEYPGIIQTNLNGHYAFASGLQADWLLSYSGVVVPTVSNEKKSSIQIPWSILAIMGIAIIVLAGGILLGSQDDDENTEVDNSRPTATLNANIEDDAALSETPAPLFKFGG